MNFVIPMAGNGERFKKAGYDTPKMLIEVHGQKLLDWSIGSLPIELCTNLVFVMLREHDIEYGLSKTLRNQFGSRCNTEFVLLNKVTRGQAETVFAARDCIDPRQGLLIFNIDTYFVSKTIKSALARKDVDGVLGAFKSNEDRFSYAKLNSQGYIEKTAEKVVISENALTGLYHFSRATDFFDIAQKHIEKNRTTKGEFYIAPMYNDLINDGKKFIIDIAREHWILGTPVELGEFGISFNP